MAVRKTRGTVGVIGLGIMGGAFARNLVTAGWRVVGYDPNPARRREARRAGVDLANNAAEVASAVPIILTSLPKPRALTETVQEIATPRLRSKVVVEMSTFAISDKEKAARALHRAGHVMIDCPVSGTGSQAKNRDLVFYASGNARTIARLRPVLMAFGRNVFNVGEFGNGSRMKYVANLLVAINNVAAAEAMVLGMKAGLDPGMIVDLVRAGAGNSRVFELRAPMMAKGRYDDVTMKISVWDKDMQVIGDYARKIRVPTPIFNATKGIYLKAMKSGLGSRDTAAVCAVLEKMAKVRRKNPRAR
ncbi:MAG TPA: NAD(P)-dependent oxidoreductase [Pseudolabrys sp.]|jgi:3-hydroxyisobutyrate dehydrogenase-like beta-hydroxyacid dehydrogenase|nr:NAD(P)-dependent oxidoreductase [Pseudolabrys sp.]